MGFSIDTAQGIFEYTGNSTGFLPSRSVLVNTSGVSGQIMALRKSSAVQTAISYRANAFANFKIWAQDDEEHRVMNATVKADLAKMERFNQFQDFRTFTAQMETYLMTFGQVFIWRYAKSIGFPDKDEFFIIPNNIATPVYDDYQNPLFQRRLKYLDINISGRGLQIPESEIAVLYDNFFNFTGYGFGESRLVALAEPISTLLSVGEVSTSLIADGGMRGIISLGANDVDMLSAPFLEADKTAAQEALKGYGNLRDQLHYLVLKGAANYVPVTAKLTDMDLEGRALDATIQIFTRYGIPSIFAAKEPRFQAMPEGRKELYTSAVIPESLPKFNALFKLKGIPERPWKYLPDVSHMDFFQDGLRKGAIAVQQVINGVLPAVEKGLLSNEEARRIIEPYI